MASIELGIAHAVQTFLLAEYKARRDRLEELYPRIAGPRDTIPDGDAPGLDPLREYHLLHDECMRMCTVVNGLPIGRDEEGRPVPPDPTIYGEIAAVLHLFADGMTAPGTVVWAIRSQHSSREVLAERLAYWKSAFRAAAP